MINPMVSILSKSLELNSHNVGISDNNTGTTNLDIKALVRYSNNAIITSDFFIQKEDELLFLTTEEFPINKYFTFKNGVYKITTIDNTIKGYYTHYAKYNNKATTYTIELDKTNLSLSIGKAHKLIPTCKNNNVVIIDPIVTYTSLDSGIASVSIDGIITGVSTGITSIQANYNSSIATCIVTVVPVVYDIVLNESESIIKEKGTYQILSTCTADNIVDIDPTVTYTSLNPNIATVSSSGLITGVIEGVATIECTYNRIVKSFVATIEKDVVVNKPFRIVGADTLKLNTSSTYSVEHIDGSPLGIRVFNFAIDEYCTIVSTTDTSCVVKASVKDELAELRAIDKNDITQIAKFDIETTR